jgi:hypothetical protein
MTLNVMTTSQRRVMTLSITKLSGIYYMYLVYLSFYPVNVRGWPVSRSSPRWPRNQKESHLVLGNYVLLA